MLSLHSYCLSFVEISLDEDFSNLAKKKKKKKKPFSLTEMEESLPVRFDTSCWHGVMGVVTIITI